MPKLLHHIDHCECLPFYGGVVPFILVKECAHIVNWKVHLVVLPLGQDHPNCYGQRVNMNMELLGPI